MKVKLVELILTPMKSLVCEFFFSACDEYTKSLITISKVQMLGIWSSHFE